MLKHLPILITLPEYQHEYLYTNNPNISLHKAKMSAAKTGKKRSAETKAKMSESQKKRQQKLLII